MLFLKLAFRNLLRQKRRSILTLSTMVIGFLFLSLAIGLSIGSYSRIIEVFTSQKTGHIQIHYKDYLDRPAIYKNLDIQIFKELKEIGFIKSFAPRVYSSGLVFYDDRALAAQVIGIDIQKEFNTTVLNDKISEGHFSDKGVAITYNLSKAMNVAIGDDLILIAQGADGSVSNDTFPVTGIIGTDKDNKEAMVCYLSLGNMQTFLSMDPNKIHEIAILTDNFNKSQKYTSKLNEILKDTQLDVQPWQVVEKGFYKAMQMDIKGMWYSLGIVMFIVAIGVLNTILMALLERRKEYGIMKALGTSPFLIFIQIMTEVFLLTIFAIFIGSIFSFAGHVILVKYGIALSTPLEFGGMVFTHYRSILSFDTYYIPAILIFLISMIISIYPAVTSAMKNPVDSMRNC